MPDFAFIAIIGLLLLVPLELFFIIILAALTRKPETPKIVVPEQKPQERYGWEDYLKIPSERKKKPFPLHIFLGVVILGVLSIALIAPVFFFGVPSFQLNLTKNETISEIQINESISVSEPAPIANISAPKLNISFPTLNVSFPELDISKFFSEKISPNKKYIYAILAAVVIVILALAVFIFFVNRRKLAVIKKAKKTADKLMKKADKETPKLSGIRQYIAPLVILFLLTVIALLVYFLRDKVRTELADFVLKYLTITKTFALNYRLYIAAGIVILLIAIILLRRLRKSSS
ncbi:hypothetical protein CMO88_01185 [Candidatus Woesearchaeota archaeon]|nr:hypothetical protein [Candidatus Woesearchaeota archaeon]|tara:strand:- start:1750 stop:2622 length:873 start_codon:yes stop_codon:yes gene_type:complete